VAYFHNAAIFAAFIALHLAAAIYRQFVGKDALLERMWFIAYPNAKPVFTFAGHALMTQKDIFAPFDGLNCG
jgi:hypothetical protein